jgi:hypothetical protein
MKPQIEKWSGLPAAIRDHLVERMHERETGLDDLSRLRLWIESRPDVPKGFGTKILAGSSFAAGAATRRRSFYPIKQREDRNSSQSSRRVISKRRAFTSGARACPVCRSLSALEGDLAGTGT